MKYDWKYWTIMLGFLICIVVIIIPKFELKIVEKSDVVECVCNCEYKEKMIYNFTNITFKNNYPKFELVNLSYWDKLMEQAKEECTTCWEMKEDND